MNRLLLSVLHSVGGHDWRRAVVQPRSTFVIIDRARDRKSPSGRAGRGMNRPRPEAWDPGHGAPLFQGDRGLFVLTAAQLRQHGLNIENLRAGVAGVVQNAREEIDRAHNVARAAAHQAHVAGAHAQHADARAEVAENIAAQVLRQGGAEVRAMQSEVGAIREQAVQYQQSVQAQAEAQQRTFVQQVYNMKQSDLLDNGNVNCSRRRLRNDRRLSVTGKLPVARLTNNGDLSNKVRNCYVARNLNSLSGSRI